MEVPYKHIINGDITVLERTIPGHYMTVAVFYAPWSRPSHRVISNLAEVWRHLDGADGIVFVAVNCWIKGSLCNDNFNSWDYPQVLIYHEALDYTPYIYSLSTYPTALSAQLIRLYDPIIYAENLDDLIRVLETYQRCVIGLFKHHESDDFKEFTQAAVIHHFEYMDSYYVPFVVLTSHRVDILDNTEVNSVVYKYSMYDSLYQFKGRHPKLKHKEMLKWLRNAKSPIRYLGHSNFHNLGISNQTSVILASHLHQNTDNYIHFMKEVMSFRHCFSEPEIKVNFLHLTFIRSGDFGLTNFF